MLSNRMIMASSNTEAFNIIHTAQPVTTSGGPDFTGLFDGIAIGDASSSRHVIVGVGFGQFNRTISSMTIGGVSATQIVRQVHTATDTVFSELRIAAVPTGTTADIDIVTSGAGARMGLQVFAMYAGNPTATDTLGATGTPSSGTIDCVAGGGIVGSVFANGNGAARTFTWSGITEASGSDVTVEGENTQCAALDLFASTQTGLSVSATASGSILQIAMVAAAFQPA